MKLLLDTNIVLDLLMDRPPFSEYAAELFAKVESGEVVGYLCGTTITTVYYLASKAIGTRKAMAETRKLLTLFEIAPVHRVVLEMALQAGFNDFEDAVVHEAACHVGVDAVITRNLKDFKMARIPEYSPDEMVIMLS